MDWSVVDSDNADGNPVVTLLLKDGPYSRSMWDFGFQALYKVVNYFPLAYTLISLATANTYIDPVSCTSYITNIFEYIVVLAGIWCHPAILTSCKIVVVYVFATEHLLVI